MEYLPKHRDRRDIAVQFSRVRGYNIKDRTQLQHSSQNNLFLIAPIKDH